MRNKKQTIGASKLFITLILVLQGCTSTRLAAGPTVAPVVKTTESYTTEPHYISPEALGQFFSHGFNVTGFGAENKIMDIQERVKNISSLYGSQAVSFAMYHMPEDMEILLKKYKTDDEYDDYFNYVKSTIQRVILCPQISWVGYKAGSTIYGFILNKADLIYPEENTVYINTMYNRQDSDSIVGLVSTIIHETSHILLRKLVEAGKLPYIYLLYPMYDERFANIRQVNFLKAAVQDPVFYGIRGYLGLLISDREKKIEDYNTSLGLPADDRTLFPR